MAEGAGGGLPPQCRPRSDRPLDPQKRRCSTRDPKRGWSSRISPGGSCVRGEFPWGLSRSSRARSAPRVSLSDTLHRMRRSDLGSPSCRSQERGFVATVQEVRGTATAGRRLVWRGPRSRDPSTGDGKRGDRRSLPSRGYERAGTPGGFTAPPDARVGRRGCGGEPRVYAADHNRRVEHSRPSRADPAKPAHRRAGAHLLDESIHAGASF